MAEEKLLADLTHALKSGCSPEQVKEQLLSDGWSPEDVNGAFALHELSLKPIGSQVVSSWKKEEEGKENILIHFMRIIGLTILVVVALIVIDWRGYDIPFVEQYTFKHYIESKVDMSYFSTSVLTQTASATTTEPLQ